MQCESLTRRGTRCRKPAQTGAACCRQHAGRTARVQVEAPAAADEMFKTLAGVFTSLAAGGSPLFSGAPTEHAAAAPGNPLGALAAALAAAAAGPTAAAGQKPESDRSTSGSAEPRSVVGEMVYKAAFGMGYGVAFPTFLLLGLLPNNALGDGLRDGAASARAAVSQLRGGT